MKKKEAVSLFDGKAVRMAEALGLTRASISEWPDTLTRRQIHEIVGAAILTGKIKGARLPEFVKREVRE